MADVIKKLAEGAMDLTELEVLTFEGQLTAIVDNENLIEWDKLLEKAKTVGEVNLVAATQFKIDGDTLFFVAPDVPESLRRAHIEATAAAQQYRQGLVEAFADLLGIRPS
jgi:hypothetical protein